MMIYTELLPSIDLDKFNDIDGIVIPVKGISQGYEKYLDETETEEVIKKAKEKNLETYLMMNSYIIQSELDKQVEYLTRMIDKVTGIYYQDYSLFQKAKELGKQDKMIFCEQAVLTNKYEIEAYKKLGVRNCVISPSLSYQEVLECLENDNDLLVKVYGHALLSYSQRDFVTNYSNKYNFEIKKDETYYLREATREDRLIIREEDKGTMIYEEKIMDGGKLVDKCNNCLIGAAFLSAQQLYEAIEYITGIKKGTVKANELANGFYDKQSVVRK